MKHTPGPWHYVKYSDGDNAIIDSEGDGRICSMETNVPEDEIDGNGLILAQAPTLLDLLESAVLLHKLEKQGTGVDWEVWFKKAEQTLKELEEAP